MKKFLSVIVALSLLMSLFCINTFAVERGECGENLRWEYISIGGDGELHIYGSGEMHDFSEGAAPWNSFAGTVSSIYLPSALTHIGTYAFYAFASLKEISFPTALSSIGEGAFKSSGLTKVVLPYKIKTVQAQTFCECDALESIEFKTVTYGSEGETVSEGPSEICDNAFEFCSSLESVVFPKTLKSIGNEVFSNCLALNSVRFNSENFESIGDGAFLYCVSLEKAELPVGISRIGAHTFEGSALKRIDLPETVTSVGENAFAFCDNLTRIDVYADDCEFFAGDETTPDSAKICVPKTAIKSINYAKKYSKPYAVLCLNRALRHDMVLSCVKATIKADGYILNTCKKCAYSQKVSLRRIKAISLLKTNFVYSGKKQYPSSSQVRVLDYNGKIIPASEYTVARPSRSTAIGAYTLSVTFKGEKYSGKLTKTYYIIPNRTQIKSLSAGKGTIKVNWVKQRTQTSGYHIRYSTNKYFTSAVKNVVIKNNNIATYTLKKLSRKRGYYVQIRTYKTVGKKNYYSVWSKAVGKVSK